MKGKERKKAEWISNNIIAIIGLFFDAILFFISIADGKEVGWSIFCVTMTGLVIFCICKMFSVLQNMGKQYKKYKSGREKIEEEVKQYGDTKRYNYYYCIQELKEDFIAKCLAIICKKCRSMISFVLIIAIICVCNPRNAHAYWDNVGRIVGLPSGEDDTPEEKSEEGGEDAEEAQDEERGEQAARNMEWRFILNKPAYELSVEARMKKQVFFDSDMPLAEWVNYVSDTVERQKGKKEGVDYKTVKDKEGNSFFTYTELEDTFKYKAEDASYYIYYEEWLQKAPYSSEYDKCIEGRKRLNEVEEEGKTGCYEIWWKLANDYQYYAQEYERQTEDAEAIFYYYVNSIYSCMEALKYSMTEEEYSTIYHFMVMRYHDICRDECIVSQEYKVKASNIYSILAETDVKNRGRA